MYALKSTYLITFLVLLTACGGSSTTPDPDLEFPQELVYQPENFPAPIYDFNKNPETEAGFQLGKRIFFDGRLSRDGTISCAECHNQTYAFTHHGHTISHGIDNRIGKRNAPPIQNMAFMRSFLLDGGVYDLDLFPIAPITNEVEMDETLANVLEKLRKTEGYPEQFEKAFGSSEITTEHFLKAISQYVNALISANSKYDKFVRKEKGGDFNEQELAGLKVFQLKCASCHATDLFTDQSFRNNGLAVYERDPDFGRAIITENPADNYKFKVASLRNLKYTAPYMHDGRFNTLTDVLNHYSEGVVDSPTLDPELKKGNALGIALSDDEKSELLAFLATLNDESFIRNPRFFPF